MPSTTKMALVGLILSVYAVYVEHKMAHKDPEEEFEALCDIQQIGASCSSAFALPVGKMMSYFGIVPVGHWLDIPNAMIGIFYYSYWLLLSGVLPLGITKVASTMALAASVFLAYQLTVLQELCLLCWTTHVLNLLLWYNAVFVIVPSNSVKNMNGIKKKTV